MLIYDFQYIKKEFPEKNLDEIRGISQKRIDCSSVKDIIVICQKFKSLSPKKKKNFFTFYLFLLYLIEKKIKIENLIFPFNISLFGKKRMKNVFECSKTGSFISNLFVCDNHFDCSFGEDEENCNIQLDELFFCRESKKFINFKFICNHIKDCENGTDEQFCGNYYLY